MDDRAADGERRQLELWPALQRIGRCERRVREARERVPDRVQALVDYLAWRWRLPPEEGRGER